MIIQGTSIPNLMIEVAGIMICIFALILIRFGMTQPWTNRRILATAFSMMLAYNLCLLLLEFTQIEAVHSPRIYVLLSAFGTYLFPVFTAHLVSLYVIHLISRTDGQYRKALTALSVFTSAEIILLLILQFTGNLVLADQEGVFYYGAANMLGYIMVNIYMVLDVTLLIIYGNILTRSQWNAIMTYLTLPILSLFFRRMVPGVYLMAFASCISMMIMLILIVYEQTEILRKKERDNEQLKVDLMLSQIQPHFLFNVLYVIQEICLIDAETASQAISSATTWIPSPSTSRSPSKTN